jgi:SAM-dependent methyltransferase
MDEKYNKITAYHYAAYRPPLHEIILKESIPIKKKFENGLDLGCGTGISTIALAKYCSHIYGIEPSEAMLKKANPHEKVTYLIGSGNSIPLTNTIIDLVTFAGSLFYAKSTVLIEELQRVCRNKSIIITYDFMVLLEDVLDYFNIEKEEISSNYDYEINFDDTINFNNIISKKDQIKFTISSHNLAHIMLGDSIIYESFVEKFNVVDPFNILVKNLEDLNKRWVLKANTYYWVYQLNLLR